MSQETLFIPEGLNYECTNCGSCCSGWAVAMTVEDHARIAGVNWGEMHPRYKNKVLFKELQKYEKVISPYSFKIKSDDGSCPFLIDKLCFIHTTKGADFKPAICQLFPYSFTVTPSGVYATVSYVSVGAVYNSGKALTDQRELLEQKLDLFRKVYPHYKPDWSKIQLAAGQPLTWDEYLMHEDVLLRTLRNQEGSIVDRLRTCSDYLVEEVTKRLPSSATQKPEPPVDSMGLNKLDRHILSRFHAMYFPAKGRTKNTAGLNTFKFWLGVFLNSSTVFQLPREVYAIDQLKEFPFPKEDKELDDILTRYAITHVFGKKFFGPGLGGFTVVTGFHHLIMVITLIRLQARAIAKHRNAPIVSLLDVLTAVRTAETQLGETLFATASTNNVELLLQGGKRARRFLSVS